MKKIKKNKKNKETGLQLPKLHTFKQTQYTKYNALHTDLHICN